MFRKLPSLIFLLALIFPATILFSSNGLVNGQEDDIVNEEAGTTENDAQAEQKEDLDMDSPDEEEQGPDQPDSDSEAETDSAKAAESTTEGEMTDEEEETVPKASPLAETVVLFPKFPDQALPAGSVIKCLVGFSNIGKNDFMVETIEASLRYPQDYSYYIQNFTMFKYSTVVEPGSQATFEYAFRPHESFGGRPFGVVVNMYYKDTIENKQYVDSVFNETITIIEHEEGMDGETFFLYLLLAALVLLLVMGLQYAYSSISGKKTSSKPVIEMGTQNTDIDYEWLPKETTAALNKSSPRRSPRNRRPKRASGSAEE